MNIYYSFIAVPEKNSSSLDEISEQTSSPHIIIKTWEWHFLFKGQAISPQNQIHYSDGVNDYFFIGEIYNIRELRVLLAKYSSRALTCQIPEILYLLYTFLGRNAISLIDGPFTFIICNGKKLSILTDALGYLPAHAIFCDGNCWITSELKMAAKASTVFFDFLDTNKLINLTHKSDDFLPIKNAIRFKPGQETSIIFDGENHPYINASNYCCMGLGADQNVSQDDASTIVFALLENSIQNCIQDEPRISLPLSGGIDSSLVAALTVRHLDSLHTYSIGSEENNEFQFASTVAKHLNTTHQEFVLSNKDILNGISESIYYNEIFDGLSAEIQSGLFNLYRLDKNTSSAMLTGYGADLIFGGVLEPDCSLTTVNKMLWQQIYRTRWTGEFSFFGALHYGVKIKHPFWNLKLISYCLNLDPSLKIAKGEVKTFIREHIHNQNLLPEVITWRKKIGIHEGSAKNKIFARMLGVDSANYQEKTRFTYELYKKFLTGELTPSEFDTTEYASLTI